MEEPPTITRKTAIPSRPHVARTLRYDEPQDIENSRTANVAALPNLTAFVGEVASQQRVQRQELDLLEEELVLLETDIEKEKTSYQSLSAERLLWEQKIALNKELGIQTTSRIEEITTELMQAMNCRRKLKRENDSLDCDIVSCLAKNKNRKIKMDDYANKVYEVESRSDECMKMTEIKQNLSPVEDQIRNFRDSMEKLLDPNEIRNDIGRFEGGKHRLERILAHKRIRVKEEEENVNRKMKDQDAAKNKLAAQKIRLRRQIERAKNATQKLRDQADFVRKQIREITG